MGPVIWGMRVDGNDWRTVKSTPLFGALPEDAAQRLIGHHGLAVYEKGVLLFQQGDRAEAFYVILDGWVKVYRITPDGDEAVVGMFSRGESFAEAAMFLGGQYPACAEVVSPSRLVKIDGNLLRKMIHDKPDLALSMLASASYHLKFLVEQIEQIKLLPGPRRLADFLVKLCPRQEGMCEIGLPYEKALIAGRLGMKPESFSRALAKLRPLGVTTDHERVTISDVTTLAAYAETGEERQPGRLVTMDAP